MLQPGRAVRRGLLCQPHFLLCALPPACSRSSTSNAVPTAELGHVFQKSRAEQGTDGMAGSENRAPKATAAPRRCPRDWKGGQGLGGGWGAVLGHYTGCSQESRQPPLCPPFWRSRWLTLQVLSPDLCLQLLFNQRGWGGHEGTCRGQRQLPPFPCKEESSPSQPQLQHPVKRSLSSIHPVH